MIRTTNIDVEYPAEDCRATGHFVGCRVCTRPVDITGAVQQEVANILDYVIVAIEKGHSTDTVLAAIQSARDAAHEDAQLHREARSTFRDLADLTNSRPTQEGSGDVGVRA